MLRRLKVVGIGFALGAVFALWVALSQMPSNMSVGDRAFAWAAIISGPILGSAWGMVTYHPTISVGWLGLLLVPAHIARPHWATGLVTAGGLIMWFFAGFVAVMVATWGG